MTLGVISPNDVDRTWHICGPMLDKALKRSATGYTLEDYKEGIKDGMFQLWTWVEDHKILCCGVTEIRNYPTMRILTLPIIGGSALKMWKESAQETMAQWGRKNGCSEMEGYAARKGWLRALPNWKPVWITIRRSI